MHGTHKTPLQRPNQISHLVRVHEDDPVNAEGEEHVKEEDLVRPDNALLVGLRLGGGEWSVDASIVMITQL